MNREIKFRVWNGKTKTWQHGPGEEVNLFGECILLGGFMSVPTEQLNDCIPLQFTGLKDKNGAEIYEGDIVKIHLDEIESKLRWKVEYDGDRAAFVIKAGNAWQTLEDVLFDGEFKTITEVIGNVFENPALLK